jgi:hypothetical protein
VDTCYAEAEPITEGQWSEMIAGEETAARPKTITLAGNAKLDPAFHVAVDRWTGGAAENLLFTGYEPFGLHWQPLVMTLDLALVRNRLASLALVWLLLRDLWEKRVYLGFGANRGYGGLQVNLVSVTGLDALGIGGVLDAMTVTLDNKSEQPDLAEVSTLLKAIEPAWQSWIDSHKSTEAAA